jgi:hypothetical protein
MKVTAAGSSGCSLHVNDSLVTAVDIVFGDLRWERTYFKIFEHSIPILFTSVRLAVEKASVAEDDWTFLVFFEGLGDLRNNAFQVVLHSHEINLKVLDLLSREAGKV